MNVTQLKISPYEARQRWLQYARAVKQQRNEDDETLRRAYRELSLGRRVINWQEEISKAGLDARGFPRLGIARPSWPKVYYGFSGNSAVFYDDRRLGRILDGEGKMTKVRIAMPGATLVPPGRSLGSVQQRLTRSVVPSIPPAYRPQTKNVDRYAILFEPSWEALPHPDPILLLPIGAGLAVVCAQWDMTPLERSVLFGK